MKTKAEKVFEKYISRDSRFSNNVLENNLRDGFKELEAEVRQEKDQEMLESLNEIKKLTSTRTQADDLLKVKIQKLEQKLSQNDKDR